MLARLTELCHVHMDALHTYIWMLCTHKLFFNMSLYTCSSQLQTHMQKALSSFMAPLLQFLCLLSLPWLSISLTNSKQVPKHYIVYMGSSSADGKQEDVQVTELAHLQLLSSVISSDETERRSLLHHYHHAFKGFSAMLTEGEVSLMSGHDDIVSIFPDTILQLHTTRSWDFLNVESGLKSRLHGNDHLSSDVIVGMIDTGIWPESPSFNDKGMREVPSKWKGVCMEAPDFQKSSCNRKLIGARYYNGQLGSTSKSNPDNSPRDFVGHGTHTSSIAAGMPVANASYYGLAHGTAKGGLPSARVAVYKACSEVGCSGAAILKAIDDAIQDGVDIISISIGMNSVFQPEYLNDPIAIGAFHAEQNGVMVVGSGGNEGPEPSAVVNTAPWIFTIAASSIDRDFRSTMILGNGKAFQGSAISISNLTGSKKYPLVYAETVAANFTPASEARSCHPGSLDYEKVAGKILVCVKSDSTVTRKIQKLVVEDARAKGLILIDEDDRGVHFDSGTFPFIQVGNAIEQKIARYINSTKYPTATILPTVEIPRYRPAPSVAVFSSRGPGAFTENILKPDIMAPGISIVAAMIPNKEAGSVPLGKKPSNFGIRSGTSMACPHVAGAAALIKSVHPRWTPSMIKSALMTTAIVYNNMGKPLTNSSDNYANPHEMGVGEISPLKALDPGLVYETTIKDHLLFLCYYGYPEKNIRSLSKKSFNCPNISLDKLISNINYPSLSIQQLRRYGTGQVIRRTVTNVGSANSTYNVKVHAPARLVVKVSPARLVFSGSVRRASFKVSFSGKDAPTGYNFGSVTWSDARHSVRTVFAVNVE